MKRRILTEGTEYAVRHLAADLLTEATERGDHDAATVSWVVGWLLRRADEAREDRER